MKILQWNLKRSTFVVWEMKRNVSVVCVCSAPNCCDTVKLLKKCRVRWRVGHTVYIKVLHIHMLKEWHMHWLKEWGTAVIIILRFFTRKISFLYQHDHKLWKGKALKCLYETTRFSRMISTVRLQNRAGWATFLSFFFFLSFFPSRRELTCVKIPLQRIGSVWKEICAR